MKLMRAADTNHLIKIGVVAVTGEDSDNNGYFGHPATNPRTHLSHNGWTPVMLATLSNAGVLPDFLIYHWYPEYNSDNDSALLQGTGNWTPDAASLRQMLTDYLGPYGSNVELLITENNSDAGAQGKQSVSLVNALPLLTRTALGQATQTEFNSFIWWDLRKWY